VFRMPSMTPMMMGKNAPRKMMYTFDASPMPNQRMASGIQAMGGIGRSDLDDEIREPCQP